MGRTYFMYDALENSAQTAEAHTIFCDPHTALPNLLVLSKRVEKRASIHPSDLARCPAATDQSVGSNAWTVKKTPCPLAVSLIRRMTAGYSRSSPTSNNYNLTRRRLQARHCKSAAGGTASGEYQWVRPSGPYLQQVVPAWKGELTCFQLGCWLLTVALVYGGLAYGCLLCWMSAEEVTFDYTDCASACWGNCTGRNDNVCELSLRLNSTLEGPLYVYYSLYNAYFNHRRVQSSWSMRQLMGLPVKDLKSDCRQHAYRNGQPVMPCGRLPEAIFNDTFQILGPLDNSTDGDGFEIPLAADGISWLSHRKGLYKPLGPIKFDNTVPPPSWPLPANVTYQFPFADADNLLAWLRAPAFSDFRKMSHRMAQNGSLPKGNYRVLIGYNYPVKSFNGGKSIIIARKTFLGGRNIVLFLLPAVTSVCYLLLCISAFIEHLRR